jgi:RNA 3'-terminal phosphate cyclase-like protein
MDEGMVKRVRGTAYSTRVSPQMANRMIDSVRGVFNKLLPDVYIFTDHYTGHEAGKYVRINFYAFQMLLHSSARQEKSV